MSLIGDILDNAITKITALDIGGVGVADIFKGRRWKPLTKKISIMVYPGDSDNSDRPHTTGHTFWEIPVHVGILVRKTEKIQGPTLQEDLFTYMQQVFDGLNLLRPGDLSPAITGFFLTKAEWGDTDTESGAGQAAPSGPDQTIEGHLTIKWQMWRVN